jgi:hypothetical protein
MCIAGVSASAISFLTSYGGLMASNSTLDPDNFPAGSRQRGSLKGHDIGSLGPSDSSDTGSDLAGLRPNAEEITFERGADEDIAGGHANDIDTDRIVGAKDAGLGGGLDQAEEAQYGVQDDEVGPSPDALHGSANSYEHGNSRFADNRHRRIAEAAYYGAQQRGFAPGQEEDDWTAAEKDIDAGQ